MKRWPYLLISGFVLALDQATKAWVASAIPNGESRPVFSWFAIVHWLNTGGLWGSLQDISPAWRAAIFFVLPLAGLAFIGFLFAKAASRFELVLISAILGGALGNLADRIRLGAVVDFLYFHLPSGKWGWPAFNVADSCLSTGIVLLLAFALFANPQSHGGIQAKGHGEENHAPDTL